MPLAPASGDPELEIGRVVGERYRIAALLGAGGMGIVARARDERLGRDVALKLLDAKAVGNAQARERMLREARAMAAFTHPSVAHVYDAGETDDGGAYLVMELVDGETVRRKIGEAWTAPERMSALVDVARALGAVHRAGLVHRDVKPENLMVRNDGRVVLLDFGIVRVTDNGSSSVALTGEGTAIGTLAYMSPEQAYGGAVDGRSDQFSFGLTAFEVLTGSHPWPAPTASAQLAAILTEPAPAVSSRTPAFAALDSVLARALAKSVDERYATMEELASALEQAARAIWAPESAGQLRAHVATPDALAETVGVSAAARPLVRSGSDATSVHAPGSATAGSATAGIEAATTPRPRRWIPLLFAAAILVGVASMLWPPPPAPQGAAPSAASASAPSPGASATAGLSQAMLEDLASGSSNAEARTAFMAGRQALHDGDGSGAIRAFEKAIALDPGFGAAHLWLSDTWASGGELIRARASFEKVAPLRASLNASNAALARAIQPCVQTEPPDAQVCIASLDAAVRASPDNAYLWYRLGTARAEAWQPLERVLADAEHALDLDPTFVPPMALKGQLLAYLGRLDEALAVFGRCSELAPAAQSCAEQRLVIEGLRGDCKALEIDAQRWRAVASDEPNVYFYLATAAIARRAPPEVAEGFMAQAVARWPPGMRWGIAYNEAMNAAGRGNFESARASLAEADRLAKTSPDQETHYLIRWGQVDLALEIGDRAEAVRIAEDTLRTKDSWAPNPRNEDAAIGGDMEPYFVDVLRESGALSAAEASRRHEAWSARWRGRVDPFFLPYLWLKTASLVDDETEARQALATLPKSGIPPFFPIARPFPFAGIGRMYLLAGRAGESLSFLRRAAEGCVGTENPVAYVRAAVSLGQALEETGDHDGACRAYRSVIERWGAAKPRSQTSEKARALARAAGCPER